MDAKQKLEERLQIDKWGCISSFIRSHDIGSTVTKKEILTKYSFSKDRVNEYCCLLEKNGFISKNDAEGSYKVCKEIPRGFRYKQARDYKPTS